jgi:lysine decarboxylase
MALLERLARPDASGWLPHPQPLALHLPAHGRGRALAPALRRLLRQPPGRWDLPELPAIGGPLEPEGAVAEAQQAAATLVGARRCWFGVNGASGLLQAALLALAAPGERVLLPRNLHRSLLHGCLLAQLKPVLYDLPFDPATGLWLPPDPAHLAVRLDHALAAGPLAAVVLVSPSYQGLTGDLTGLIAAVHHRGLPVLLDEAHGAHLGLDPRLPPAGLACGADLVVQSLQKAAGGLAQSAVLLACSGCRPPAQAPCCWPPARRLCLICTVVPVATVLPVPSIAACGCVSGCRPAGCPCWPTTTPCGWCCTRPPSASMGWRRMLG